MQEINSKHNRYHIFTKKYDLAFSTDNIRVRKMVWTDSLRGYDFPDPKNNKQKN